MPLRLLILSTLLAGLAGPVLATTVSVPGTAVMPRGDAMVQRFLPSDVPEGALSVVTTAAGASCVASRRIDIAQSSYLDRDGTPVPFARIIRSVGSSVQAIAGRDDDVPVFRVQLKFSPDPSRPIWLDPGDGQGPLDVVALLEPSTDSLRLEGALAARLAAAFAGGLAVRLTSTSVDTGHVVGDLLPAPDLAALADCRKAELAGDPLPPGAEAAQVTLRFAAAPTPETLASPETLKTCAMTPTDLPVHEGRLTGTTGMFAQTDRVFVAFDSARQPVRVYVPGIFDAAVDATGQGQARVSRAADANLPDAENDVKGCLGAASMTVCAVPVPGDADGWTMQPCDMVPGAELLTSGLPGRPGTPGTPGTPGRPGGIPPAGFSLISSVPPDDGSVVPPAKITVVRKPPPDPPPPPPIPLPAAGWLMLAGLGALVAVRRRRRAG